MRSATRSADIPGPGSRFGHDVTMRQRLPCARATEGAAIAAAPTAPATRLRRVSLVMVRSLPPGMKMMRRAAALADRKLVGGRDRGGDVGFGVRDGFREALAFGQAR